MTPIARTDTSLLGQWWWTVDRWLLSGFLLLMILGGLLSFAASPSVAEHLKLSSFFFVKRHFVYLGLGLFVMVAVSFLSVHAGRRVSLILFLVSLLLVVATPFIGVEIKGATRWISVGGVSLQPSEFLKPAFVVISAWMFSEAKTTSVVPGNQVATVLYLLVVFCLLCQPDIGMTTLVSVVWFTQFFLAGLPLFWIFFGGIVGLVGLTVAYFFVPYVSRRIDQFLNPEASGKFSQSYQINQSLESFLNGGFMGKGPGEGTVKNYLPDAHADFVFAVTGEEFGALLCLIIIGVFAGLMVRSFLKVLRVSDLFVFLSVVGLSLQICLQAFINMASAMNLIPTKGMTLPFMSYGGSSMVALAFGAGLILCLTRNAHSPRRV